MSQLGEEGVANTDKSTPTTRENSHRELNEPLGLNDLDAFKKGKPRREHKKKGEEERPGGVA